MLCLTAAYQKMLHLWYHQLSHLLPPKFHIRPLLAVIPRIEPEHDLADLLRTFVHTDLPALRTGRNISTQVYGFFDPSLNHTSQRCRFTPPFKTLI